MATEDREMMEARGAGESCPTFPRMVPGDSMSEGKPRASLEVESLKPDSSSNQVEEMETCEDRSCPRSPKSLSSKASPTAKGQAGDGPEPAELPPTHGTDCSTQMELEKIRMEFELTRLRCLHEENERQRQHEEVMEQLLQQQVASCQFPGGFQDLLLPQNQFAMFLYCFIFIHMIYVTKEMVFFLFSKHYLFCIAAILFCLIKTFWSYFQVPLLFPSLGTPSKLAPSLPDMQQQPKEIDFEHQRAHKQAQNEAAQCACNKEEFNSPSHQLPNSCSNTHTP
ncbi:transmembrane protein 247 [Carlito syrichta]|uniref:Transmembrane protein 247 n=1 Tax=Carlito syrichta TaxID=1868482 RepID=A0A3Q0EG96_CARSF|nr:transmembrane protein 247 [Carlito syrichta]